MLRSRRGELQNYILTTCYLKKSKRLLKREIFDYYQKKVKLLKKDPKVYNKIHSTIIKTIEKMIEKGYINGYGYRSPKEWHIREISLTPKGKRKAKALLAIRRLPL